MSKHNDRVLLAARIAKTMEDFDLPIDVNAIAARVHLRWEIDYARNGEPQYRFCFRDVGDLPYSFRLTFTRAIASPLGQVRFETSLLGCDEGDEMTVLANEKLIADEYDFAQTYAEDVGEDLDYADFRQRYLSLEDMPNARLLLDVIDVCKLKLAALLSI